MWLVVKKGLQMTQGNLIPPAGHHEGAREAGRAPREFDPYGDFQAPKPRCWACVVVTWLSCAAVFFYVLLSNPHH